MFHFEAVDNHQEFDAVALSVLTEPKPHRYKKRKERAGMLAIGPEPYGEIQPDSLRRLFGALVWQALRDYYRGSMALRGDAAEWFGSRATGFGTFETACASLNLNPATVRAGLGTGRWREAALTYVEEDGDQMLCGMGTT